MKKWLGLCTLVQGQQRAGLQTAVWDGRDDGGQRAAAGAYIYRLAVGHTLTSRKMVLAK